MTCNQTIALPVLLVFWLMVLASVFKTEFVRVDRLLHSENVKSYHKCFLCCNKHTKLFSTVRAAYHACFFPHCLFNSLPNSIGIFWTDLCKTGKSRGNGVASIKFRLLSSTYSIHGCITDKAVTAYNEVHHTIALILDLSYNLRQLP